MILCDREIRTLLARRPGTHTPQARPALSEQSCRGLLRCLPACPAGHLLRSG